MTAPFDTPTIKLLATQDATLDVVSALFKKSHVFRMIRKLTTYLFDESMINQSFSINIEGRLTIPK